MHDLLPAEAARWQTLEAGLLAVLCRYGYEEIRTPILEERALFERSVGEATDIVEKEMYTLTDRKGRQLALRPEGTAAVVRAYIEANLAQAQRISRLYYAGPMFRYDRPQKGRYRQFSQVGVELLGGTHPFFDGEVISLLGDMVQAVGLKDFFFELNSVGCKTCKQNYGAALKDFLEQNRGSLCEDCGRRMETNVLRVLDCKVPGCRQLLSARAPEVVLCDICTRHFDGVKKYLDALAVPYRVNRHLVRGLDYYTSVVFELFAGNDPGALAAGGRYDNLVEELGGPAVPAVGFAIGLDRLVETVQPEAEKEAPVQVIFLGETAKEKGIKLLGDLRKNRISVRADYDDRSVKSAMRSADKERAEWCVLVGENEINQGLWTLKNLKTHNSEALTTDQLIARLREKKETITC